MFDVISAHELEDTTTIDLFLPSGANATIPAPGEDKDGKPNRKQLTITVRRLSSAPMQRFVNASKNKTAAPTSAKTPSQGCNINTTTRNIGVQGMS